MHGCILANAARYGWRNIGGGGMKESDIQNRALLALSHGPTRLFRSNTGTGWVGKLISRVGRTITLQDYRPLHAGLCKGSSDTIGWHSVTITPDMVGTKIAVFTAIEFKAARRRPTTEQAHFGEQVQAAGGLFGVAWTVEDAVKILGSYKALIYKA